MKFFSALAFLLAAGIASADPACSLTVTAHNGGPVCPSYHTSSLHARSNQSNVTYQWTRSGSVFWWLDGPDHQDVSAGTYTVWARDSSGCTATAQTVIPTHDVPTAFIDYPPSICGNTAVVTLRDPHLYTNLEWGVVNATITGGQGTPRVELTAIPEALGNAPGHGIWVWISLNHATTGCRVATGTMSYRIQVNAAAETSISTPAAACPRASLTATVADGGAGTSYAWSVTNAQITSGQGTRTIQYTPEGNADVTVSASVSNASCTATGTAVVTVDGPTAHVEGSFALCADDDVSVPVALAGAPPFRIVWSDGVVQENIDAAGTSRTFTSNDAGTYWITDVSDAQCAGTTSGYADVLQNAAPDITAEPQHKTILSGQTATLSVAAEGYDLVYRWYKGISGDRSKLVSVELDSSFTTPKLTRTTQYWVEVSNSCGDAESRTATVSVGAGKRRSARH